jgi:NADH-quinone oxidoreductase subunit K
MIGLVHYLTVGALLFVIGLYGLLTKRNIVAVLMCIELMLNAVNINLIAFSRFITPELATGQVFSLFTITVAACEVTVGLALVFRVYHDRDTVLADRLNWLRW